MFPNKNFMKQNAQRRTDTGIIKHNTQLCKFYKMSYQWQSAMQLCLPSYHINGGWGETCSMTTGWARTPDTRTWWRIATGKRRDGISARPWHGYIGLVPFGGEEGSKSSLAYWVNRLSPFFRVRVWLRKTRLIQLEWGVKQGSASAITNIFSPGLGSTSEGVAGFWARAIDQQLPCWRFPSCGSLASTILERTLEFLLKVLNAGSRCVSGRLVEAMCDNISSLC